MRNIGSVIIFLNFLRVFFLDGAVKKQEWIGTITIIMGLSVIGSADYFSTVDKNGKSDTVFGDLLIVIAQLIIAIQMVIKQRFVSEQDIPPLQAVGWEGMI